MMTNNTIKIGIIGAGRVSEHYKNIFNNFNIKNYSVVGVADVIEEKANNLASSFNCKHYTSIKELIERSKPNLVLVLTPSGLHYDHAKYALTNNCHVLVEKPVTMIPSQAYELRQLAIDNKLLLCVAFQNRFNPAIKALKNALESNRFGKITTATVRLRWCRYQDYYNDDWHGTWQNDGGVINQQAIHHVDALNWLLGPVDEVCTKITNRLNTLEAEDTFVAIIKFDNGSLGTIEATTAARPDDMEASISVLGEKGTVVIGGIALNKIEMWKFQEKRKEDVNIISDFSIEVPNGYGLSHKDLLQSVIDTLLNSSIKSPIPIEDCIATCELVHSFYVSHESNSWVSIKDKLNSKKLGIDLCHK